MAKILLVDDNPQNIELLSLRLEAAGHHTTEARNGEEALDRLTADMPDLMILDLQMPKLDGLQVLNRLKDDRNDIPVVVISAFATVERAVEAMKAGAMDFITKPFDPTHLELVVERALERTSLAHHNRFLTEELNARYHFVMGNSPAMTAAYEAMIRAAGNDNAVLLYGEGGTGKEVAARLIHRESARCSGPFAAIRCGVGRPDQVAAELFGDTTRKGRIELAAGGTLFLDDVASLSTAAQERLLSLLTSHGFTRIGGDTVIPADIRVIASARKELLEGVSNGTFLEALHSQLTSALIPLSPLRERPEDVSELAAYFVEKYAAEVGRPVAGFDDAALSMLCSYHWPGNIRELSTIIERAVATGRDEKLSRDDLGIAVREVLSGPGGDTRAQCTGPYHEQVQEARRYIIMQALRDAEGETERAAKILELPNKELEELLVTLKIRR